MVKNPGLMWGHPQEGAGDGVFHTETSMETWGRLREGTGDGSVPHRDQHVEGPEKGNHRLCEDLYISIHGM